MSTNIAGSRLAALVRSDAFIYATLCALLAIDALRVVLAGAAAAQTSPPIAIDLVAIAAATFALIALGRRAARRGVADGRLAFAIGAAVGFLFFARTLGLARVDPTSIDWLMLQDWAQHYSGWVMFRHAPWHWPPGSMPEIWYPVGTAIVYTDSLPLLALALKPFSAWLPEPFQYIGFWLLASFTLQGAFGALLVTRVSNRPAAVLAGAALFVFAPLILYRIGHDTLTAHWLLLAGLWLYFRAPAPARLLAEAWPWWLLTAIAALVHPYLCVMLLAIQCAAWWKRARIDHARATREAMLALCVSLVIALSAWWLCGAMSIRMADSKGGVEFGRYTMNLLAFVDPLYQSNFVPTIHLLPGQAEGFAYVGIGMLALLLLVLVDLVRERRVLGVTREWWPIGLVAFALLAFATGAVLTVGTSTIAGIELHSRMLGAFRASGRFVWVAYYVLMLIAIVHVLRRFQPVVATSVLTVALVLQIADLSAAHERVAQRRVGTHVDKIAQLEDPRWAELAAGRHHLTLLPPPACGEEAAPYLPMLLFAANHGMTFNSGYLARWNLRKTARYCSALGHELMSGPWSADDLYIVGATWKQRFEKSAPAARCELLDGYQTCVIDGSAPGP